MYVYIFNHPITRTYSHSHKHTHTHTHTQTHTHTHTHTYTHTHTHTYTHTHTDTQRHTHTHARTHAHSSKTCCTKQRSTNFGNGGAYCRGINFVHLKNGSGMGYAVRGRLSWIEYTKSGGMSEKRFRASRGHIPLCRCQEQQVDFRHTSPCTGRCCSPLLI